LGHLERYEPGAVEAFREIRTLGPDWLPGSINLAIALMNEVGERERDVTEEALGLLESVLASQPDNLHAHYCRGMIFLWKELYAKAQADFRIVAEKAPDDYHAWYWLGSCAQDRDKDRALRGAAALTENIKEAITAYRRALECNPSLSRARFRLATAYRMIGDVEGQKRELAIWQETNYRNPVAFWGDELLDHYYGSMGRLAEVIAPPSDPTTKPAPLVPPRFGPFMDLRIKLAPGDRWVSSTDFAGVLSVIGRARSRFGAPVAVLDADGDGRLDLFLPASIAGPDGIRDAHLRNLGQGAFEDVTGAGGFPTNCASIGAAAGDFDADGRVDLFLTGVGGNRLYRNLAPKGFADVTAEAGVAGVPAVSLTAQWIDLDQDGDLDLYVINHAPAANCESALTSRSHPGQANSVYRNNGKPPEVRGLPQQYHVPVATAPDFIRKDHDVKTGLSIAFSPWPDMTVIGGGDEPHTGVAALDLDGDRDLDLILTADGTKPCAVLNDRLGRFRAVEVQGLKPFAADGGLLVSHLDTDDRPDIVRLDASGLVAALRNRTDRSGGAIAVAFEPWPNDLPPCASAEICDLDNDGYSDVLALDHNNARQPIRWARNEATALASVPLLPDAPDGPSPSTGMCLANLVGDALPDILLLRDGGPPRLGCNLGNAQHWLALSLAGRWQSWGRLRSNPHGWGARVRLEGPGLASILETTGVNSGLGQSVAPWTMGLGTTKQAALLRIRWPDGAMQTETRIDADRELTFEEETHRVSTCPILFAWDGSRFQCVSDLLAGGGLGYFMGPGIYAEPDRDETVAIPGEMLRPDGGVVRIAVAEPMDETAYLDRLKLECVDRPAGFNSTPDERFSTGGQRPTGELVDWRISIEPVKATDLAGRDLTEVLRRWDRRTADQFPRLTGFNGYSEEHGIILDFGDRLSRFGPTDRLILCLAGWVEYPFSQTNYAAETAGIALNFPVVERQQDDGSWKIIEPNAGCPAGLPRMTTLDLTGKLSGPRCVIRLRTNLECYWDQAFVALREASSGVRLTELPLKRASLAYRGHMSEVSPDGRTPMLDDHAVITASPLALMKGTLTRYGDVAPLLRDDDDRLCVIGPGDEVVVEFDAGPLPVLPTGWNRGYVLRATGYCKDADLFTASGDAVGPLPWKEMRSYPYGPDGCRSDDSDYRSYLREYQTRLARRRGPSPAE
jgi:hypothetical protein